MLDRNSQTGFGFITRQSRGWFTAPQPSNPYTASGYEFCFTGLSLRLLNVYTSERGFSLDISVCKSREYSRTPRLLPSLSDRVFLSQLDEGPVF